MTDKLEIHYYLNSESHFVDAFVRSKCEAELLAIILEVSDLLGFEFLSFGHN